MKVIYITNVDTSKIFGGSLGCLKFVKGLALAHENGLIDDYKIISFSRSNSIEPHEKIIHGSKNKYLTALTKRVHGNLSELVLYYREILTEVEKFKPDAVILQNSYLGDLAVLIREHFQKIKIVGNFDNFELECYKAFVNKHNFLIRFGRKMLEIPLVERLERSYLTNIDFATFLTNKDKEVVFKYYGTEKPRMKFPIMV